MSSGLFDSTLAALTDWSPTDEHDESLRHTISAFLETAGPVGCLREHVPGHITASALVLDSTGTQTLLTLHPRVGRWIQLGGHCEPGDISIAAAALREASEESGIDGLKIAPKLIGAHTHPIKCSLGVPTRHLDLRFLVTAPPGAIPVRSHESEDLRWWPIDKLPANAEPETIAKLVAAARMLPGRGPDCR